MNPPSHSTRRPGEAKRTAQTETQRLAWPAYYHAHANRVPRRLFLAALEMAGEEGVGRQAIDLGCGSGTESLLLLEHGWRVHAVDGNADAIAGLEARAPRLDAAGLTTEVALFHAAALPPAHFIYAGMSLPFCAPEHFAAFWVALRTALLPGAIFAGHFLGPCDDWATDATMTACSRSQLETLLEGTIAEQLVERNEEGPSSRGAKRWHLFEVIARQPSDGALA